MPHEPDILDTEEVYRCWLVWKLANDGGRPYLVAVDTTEACAKRHEHAVKEEARTLHGLGARELRSLVQIEPSFLNHAYGETMGQSYDRSKKQAQEIRRATIDELEAARGLMLHLALKLDVCISSKEPPPEAFRAECRELVLRAMSSK